MLFALAVALLAVLFVRLGQWQFDRLEAREQRNAWTEANLAADPVPVEDVLSVGGSVAPDEAWRRVVARGVYDESASIVVRYQTRDGAAGIDLVTPLVTPGGTAVLVDRGWVRTDNNASVPDDLPAPPPGPVRVVGFVRADATGRGIDVENGSTRAVSSARIGATVDYPVYGGFLDAEAETPAPADELVRAELPDLGEGPHFFYGLQWWFFGAFAVFGFGYLAWDERRRQNRPAPTTPAEPQPVRRS